MPRWTLDWRKGPLTVELPDDGSVRVIERPELPTLGTPLELVKKALADPIGSPPLAELVKPADRVALLVTDMQDRILGQEGVGDYLLDELNRLGVPDDKVTLVHAAGMHGHPKGSTRLGPKLISRVGRYVEHDPFDEATHAFVGVTRLGTPVWVNKAVAEADFVMGVGQCSPSLYGFQGGAGIILPGVAAADTTRFNHNHIVTTRTSSAWGPGNPMREDVMDAGDLARLRLKVDFAGNNVFAGYFREEWPRAVAYVEQNVLVEVEPADLYVFAPPGGAELMSSIYMQVESACRATKDDGVVVAVVSAHKHKPFPPRPLAETMEEFLYVTRRWCEETGEDNPLHEHWHFRDGVCKEELLARPLEEISRVVARFQGEPRSTTHVWSHRRSIEARKTILVSDGVSPEDGAAMGFLATYPDFARAYDHALSLAGPRPRTSANMPPRGAVPFVR
jgi:nickel-dependent lactate racemase